MPPDELTYPPIEIPSLGEGGSVAIAPDVHWLRMPVMGSLEAINIWVLEADESLAIVDTGLRTPATALAWNGLFKDGLLSRKSVDGVYLTHLHPDHSGMAGWLVERTGAPLYMSRLEYFMLRALAADTGRAAPKHAVSFYRQAGWGEAALDMYRARFGDFGKLIYPLPETFHGIVDGQRLSIAGSEWEVVVGRGHSPEHVSFYSASRNLLIAGDQVLPAISSNVSVHPLEPTADPLTDWLETLAAIKTRVPDDVLVLPSHGRPFHGLHRRIDHLIAGHEAGLGRLLETLGEPRRAVDVFPALFKRDIDAFSLGLATGESLAHLACLRTRGLAEAVIDEHGVAWWHRSDRADVAGQSRQSQEEETRL